MKRIITDKLEESIEEQVARMLSMTVAERLEWSCAMMDLAKASGIDQTIFDDKEYIVLRKNK